MLCTLEKHLFFKNYRFCKSKQNTNQRELALRIEQPSCVIGEYLRIRKAFEGEGTSFCLIIKSSQTFFLTKSYNSLMNHFFLVGLLLALLSSITLTVPATPVPTQPPSTLTKDIVVATHDSNPSDEDAKRQADKNIEKINSSIPLLQKDLKQAEDYLKEVKSQRDVNYANLMMITQQLSKVKQSISKIQKKIGALNNSIEDANNSIVLPEELKLDAEEISSLKKFIKQVIENRTKIDEELKPLESRRNTLNVGLDIYGKNVKTAEKMIQLGQKNIKQIKDELQYYKEALDRWIIRRGSLTLKLITTQSKNAKPSEPECSTSLFQGKPILSIGKIVRIIGPMIMFDNGIEVNTNPCTIYTNGKPSLGAYAGWDGYTLENGVVIATRINM